MSNLVIVESPTKAKTISKFLDKTYKVESSFGHVRDLPQKKLGVNVKQNFEPDYEIPAKAEKVITKLKAAAAKAKDIYLATDEDREGEAISWHLQEILKIPTKKIKRIAFHEITKKAILAALQNPRSLDLNLVNAQQARRILDRLVGYKLSPFLWKKVMRGLSAGRVQSVAVRLIVEKEKEIQKFKQEEYWTIEGLFNNAEKNVIEALLVKINGKKLSKFFIDNQEKAEKIVKDIEGRKFIVTALDSRQIKKSPKPPFTTSTLQQAAYARLGFSTKQTMMLAQQLYEGIALGSEGQVGLITYMRTDSLNLSQDFLQETQIFGRQTFGINYFTDQPKFYKTKSKLAQEAHEAIRPTHVNYTPEKIQPYLDQKQYKLYRLIWQRAVASQMTDAIMLSTSAEISDKSQDYTFKATGNIVKFDGFSKVYPIDTKEKILPALKEQEELILTKLAPNQHFTQPPSRYSEATLVKALEELGIGRPSTYAPTIHTITERNYVTKNDDKKLHPTEIAFLVSDLLVENFPEIMDYQFTAQMEDNLDDIAQGKKEWQPVLEKFYTPFISNLKEKEKTISKKELTETASNEKCDKCGSPMLIKLGRFGKFLACSNYPECKSTKPLGEDKKAAAPTLTDEKCDKCGAAMQIKTSRYGQFLGCSNYPQCKNIKPLLKKLNIKCPQCSTGELVERKSKTKRIFYSCSQYPNCQFSLWAKPIDEKCPNCQSLLVYGPKKTIKCSNKECSYKREAPDNN